MRIQHNISALNAYRNYNNNTSTVNKNLEKLSSGYKINRAGDDAAGLAISEKMRRQITGLKVYQKNAQDGIGMIQTAEGALTEVHSMLNRMYELNEQARNSLYDTEDQNALQSEYNELVKEIDRIGASAEYNGKKLLDGTGVNSKALVIDENNNLTINLTYTLGTDTNSQSVINAATLKIGSSTATLSSATGAVGKLETSTAIKNAISGVSAFRAKLGAYQNRLEHTVANLSVMHENMTNAESSIRDTDVADEMMAYTKNNIMIQSAQAMLAQANQQPQGVLQLLQ
ncbi:MAG: flagellin [Oscillibacter sp.]|nr:flagellin [Oscillibacter sp.]